MHNSGLILQTLAVEPTTQGDGLIGLMTAYGVDILVGAVVVVLFCIGISYFRRMGGGTREGDKRF